MNKQNNKDYLISDIRREIDRFPNVYKKQQTNKSKCDFGETLFIMNIFFSLPIGSIFIMVGALHSNFSMFIYGIIIFLEGIFVYALFDVFFYVIKKIQLNNISRKITKL